MPRRGSFVTPPTPSFTTPTHIQLRYPTHTQLQPTSMPRREFLTMLVGFRGSTEEGCHGELPRVVERHEVADH